MSTIQMRDKMYDQDLDMLSMYGQDDLLVPNSFLHCFLLLLTLLPTDTATFSPVSHILQKIGIITVLQLIS
jgi:hypothetical protein